MRDDGAGENDTHGSPDRHSSDAYAAAVTALRRPVCDAPTRAAAGLAVTDAVRHGARVWDLAHDTGGSGIGIAMLIDDDRLRRVALEIELGVAVAYVRRVHDALRGECADDRSRR